MSGRSRGSQPQGRVGVFRRESHLPAVLSSLSHRSNPRVVIQRGSPATPAGVLPRSTWRKPEIQHAHRAGARTRRCDTTAATSRGRRPETQPSHSIRRPPPERAQRWLGGACGVTVNRSRRQSCRQSKHVVYLHPERLMVPRPLAEYLSHLSPRDPQYLRTLSRYACAQRSSWKAFFPIRQGC